MGAPETEPVPPIRPRVRRLSLLDLIVAIAACAVWFVLVRSWYEGMQMNPPWYRAIWWLGVNNLAGGPLAYGLILASPTLVLLRCRQPRPTRRRLWRQPGLVASVAATVGFMIGWLSFAEGRMATLNPSLIWFAYSLRRGAPSVAPFVVGGWLALLLSGRWRAERSGIDRLGRIVGWLWLLEWTLGELPLTKWVSIIRNISDGSRS